MSWASAIRLVLAVVLSAALSPACRADDSVLDAIYRCDPNGSDAQCGTDEKGQRMTCYVGSAQLGGEAFCTQACDPSVPTEPGFRCTSSGALLEVCDPGADANSCPDPLNCYRTDVLSEVGLCLWAPICPYAKGTTELDDSQCGISHSVCAGDVLRELASGSALSALLRTNNLHCVAPAPCSTFGCSGAKLPESCPSEFYGTNFGLPITCAAHCDKFACPPNFTCAASASPGAPPVCLPGVPGNRCTSDDDCLVGECLDTGAGFSVCTPSTGCDTDEVCLLLGSLPAFVCLRGESEASGHCVLPSPFQGMNCDSSGDCSTELRCGAEACPPRVCSAYSPHELDPPHGECRFQCGSAADCPAFLGVPHVCLAEGGCYPGMFGIPCTSSSECFANLSCEAVPPDERSRSEDPKICTVSCNEDVDCSSSANPWLGLGGYCVESPDPAPETKGYCRVGGWAGRPCEKDAHCRSGTCMTTEGGAMVCASE
jgi:hypothetical protein